VGFFGGGGSAASNMVGATSSAAGTAGLVPAPAAGQQGSILFGDASFKKYIMPAGGSYGTDYVGFPYISFQAWNTSAFNVAGGLLMRGAMFYPAGTYNRIACYVSSGSSGKNMIAGIYEIDTNGYETSLVTSGTISLASTGVAEVSVSNFTLESKFYICAWIIDSSGATVWYGANAYFTGRPFSNFDASNSPNLNSNMSHAGGYISRSYASGLPTSLATTGYTSYNPSLLWVRKV